jgi:small conductance mechanosensitive channel
MGALDFLGQVEMSVLSARLGTAILYIFVGWLIARLFAGVFGQMALAASEARAGHDLSQQRAATIQALAAHLARFVIYVITGVLVLSIFVDSTGLLTFLGLFSAAFGLGARPLVSDYLSGAIFLFEDQYNVGEKVEIFGIEGTVLDVNLRTTTLRSPSGETYIIPNGEVRVVRNFGRGEFSLASVRITIKSSHLAEAMAALETLTPMLPAKIPELTETPRILSEDGALGDQVNLTIFAKARYSEGAEARRKLLSVINDALEQAGIENAA